MKKGEEKHSRRRWRGAQSASLWAGPRDTVNAIMHQLMRSAGEGNFAYLITAKEPSFDRLKDDGAETEE